MAIYIGSQKIKDIYVGSKKIKYVYRGGQIVYSAAPPPEPIVLFNRGISNAGFEMGYLYRSGEIYSTNQALWVKSNGECEITLRTKIKYDLTGYSKIIFNAANVGDETTADYLGYVTFGVGTSNNMNYMDYPFTVSEDKSSNDLVASYKNMEVDIASIDKSVSYYIGVNIWGREENKIIKIDCNSIMII